MHASFLPYVAEWLLLSKQAWSSGADKHKHRQTHTCTSKLSKYWIYWCRKSDFNRWVRTWKIQRVYWLIVCVWLVCMGEHLSLFDSFQHRHVLTVCVYVYVTCSWTLNTDCRYLRRNTLSACEKKWHSIQFKKKNKNKVAYNGNNLHKIDSQQHSLKIERGVCLCVWLGGRVREIICRPFADILF